MNSREKTVLLTLTVMFLLGAGISLLKRAKFCRQAERMQLVIQGTFSAESSPYRKVDLNRATRYQLEALPGIGPVIATRIIQYREQHRGFRRVAELRCISGIGPKRFAALKELVAIGTEMDDTMTNRFKVDSMTKRIKD
ncbi:MAG: helix-hairpin-helix domain-containing protein [candidate division WOR-3 bacterium]